MSASLRGMAVWCAAVFVLGAGCGEADDLDGLPPDSGGGTSGAGATGGTAGDPGAGTGGTSASGGASASGGSGGEMGSSAEDGSAGTGGSGAPTQDAATDSDNSDGASDSGGHEDSSTDANFCLPCPKPPPVSGSACRPCSRPTVCTYNGCLGSSNAVITATCEESSRTWVIKSDPCNSFQCGAPPGGRRCNANQICVLPYATCVDNPCADDAFSCSCAQSACPGAGYRCLEQGDRTIYCNCLTC